MSTIVHSKGIGGGQNWLKFGPRSSWMTPKFCTYWFNAHTRWPSLYYVRVFWGFFEPPTHPPTYIRTFSLHKVCKGKLPFSGPPTLMSLRNIKMAPYLSSFSKGYESKEWKLFLECPYRENSQKKHTYKINHGYLKLAQFFKFLCNMYFRNINKIFLFCKFRY